MKINNKRAKKTVPQNTPKNTKQQNSKPNFNQKKQNKNIQKIITQITQNSFFFHFFPFCFHKITKTQKQKTKPKKTHEGLG